MGTHFRGWQRQDGIVSVQETLENVLYNFTGKKISAIGCGRTDAGVHASHYALHIDVENPLSQNAQFTLNKMLPDSISVKAIFLVEPNCHAQFSAVERSYTYHIHTIKNPFIASTSALYLEPKLDTKLMQQATALIPQYTDFRAFCLTPDKHNNTICKVSEASFYANKSGDKFQFNITANRFLRGMVRTLVGKLIELGAGRMTLNTFEHHLKTGEAFQFLNQAYPQGLYLSDVVYPDIDIEDSET